MGQLKLHFLGTGTAFNTDGRASAGILVEPEGARSFLVDAGPTLMSLAQRSGADCTSVDRLFLTHLHGDHVAGWPFLLLHQVVLQRRTRPFDVYGPPGSRECLEGLARLCYAEVLERQRFEVRYHELAVEPARGIPAGEGMELETHPMDHHPSSIGLCFDVAGRRVAVSGDTRWCDELERLAAGSDLLIVECTTEHRDTSAHVSLEELREARGRLRASNVVLVHLTDRVAEALATSPIPGVVAAYDGMTVELSSV